MTSTTARPIAARVRDLRRAHEERSRELGRVRDAAAWLVPGPYVPVAPGLWRRVGTRLPDHLHRTKGHDARGLRRRAIDAAVAVVRPTAFVVRRTAAGRHAYPIAVAAYDGGTVLLDPRGGTVARLRTEPAPRADELRRRLARHVATPAFETVDDGHAVVEELVTGGTVLDLPAGEVEAVVRRLCADWAGLTAAEAGGTWDEVLDTTFEACAGLDLPEAVQAVVARGVPDEARGWPLVPAATDARLRNVVLRDGVPVLIDLGDVRLEPCLAYPLGAVVDGGPALLARYLDGDLDDAFAELSAAAGRTWPPGPWSRLELLAVRTCVVTVQADGAAPERVAAGVRRRWRPVERALAARRAP